MSTPPRLAFEGSKTPEAQESLKALRARYGECSVADCDVIVA